MKVELFYIHINDEYWYEQGEIEENDKNICLF